MGNKNYLLYYFFGLTIEALLFFILWSANVVGGDILFVGIIWVFSIFYFSKTLYKRKNIFVKLMFILLVLVFGYALIFLGNSILESRIIDEPLIIGYTACAKH